MEYSKLSQKTENISLYRQVFTAQHGSFLRSEGNVYPIDFLLKKVHLYNIVIIVKTCLGVVSLFYFISVVVGKLFIFIHETSICTDVVK